MSKPNIIQFACQVVESSVYTYAVFTQKISTMGFRVLKHDVGEKKLIKKNFEAGKITSFIVLICSCPLVFSFI